MQDSEDFFSRTLSLFRRIETDDETKSLANQTTPCGRCQEVGIGVLKGKKVNLNLVEKSELSVLAGWFNDLDFIGQFEPIPQ